MNQSMHPQLDPVVLTTDPYNMNSLNCKSFDAVSLWERVCGDMELLRELVVLFGQECPRMLEHLENAVMEGNALELQKAGHKIKGAVLQFSATEASKLAAQLEEMGRIASLQGASEVVINLEINLAGLMEELTVMAYQGPAR